MLAWRLQQQLSVQVRGSGQLLLGLQLAILHAVIRAMAQYLLWYVSNWADSDTEQVTPGEADLPVIRFALLVMPPLSESCHNCSQ